MVTQAALQSLPDEIQQPIFHMELSKDMMDANGRCDILSLQESIYYVPTLIELAQSLPVGEMDAEQARFNVQAALLAPTWYTAQGQVCPMVLIGVKPEQCGGDEDLIGHLEAIQSADINDPVIMLFNNQIIDGLHRFAKRAYMILTEAKNLPTGLDGFSDEDFVNKLVGTPYKKFDSFEQIKSARIASLPEGVPLNYESVGCLNAYVSNAIHELGKEV